MSEPNNDRNNKFSKLAINSKVSALDIFLKSQPSDRVKYARTAFTRKILGSQKLSEIDKQILYLNIGQVIVTNTALALTVLFINRLKWIMAGAGLYVISKAAYDIPKRMAFADFMIDQQKLNIQKPQI